MVAEKIQGLPQYSYLLQSEYSLASTLNNLFLENEIQDSQLRMMLPAGHLTEESQIALTLKTLCGLNTNECKGIPDGVEETINKRIYRKDRQGDCNLICIQPAESL